MKLSISLSIDVVAFGCEFLFLFFFFKKKTCSGFKFLDSVGETSLSKDERLYCWSPSSTCVYTCS